MDFGDNIWDVDWAEPGEYEARPEAAGFGGVRGKRLRRQLGATLSAAVWELDPGSEPGAVPLPPRRRGAPDRPPRDADAPLARGRARAEGGRGRALPARSRGSAPDPANRSDAVVRYVLAASQGTPEIIEYPDSGKIAAMARTETSGGGPLFTVNRLADAVDYYDGESGG